MSEFDEMDLDEDELDLLAGPDEMSPEDIFGMVLINKKTMKRIKVNLEDEAGDTVDLTKTITELLGWMKEKMADDKSNQFTDQIMPLLSQSVVSCLGRLIGIPATAFHLTQDTTRVAIIWSMCLSFLLLKYVQTHNLKIFTIEEDVTQEEIDEIERKTEANKTAMMGMMMGVNPRETLSQLREEGIITDSDLRDMLGETEEETDDDNDMDSDNEDDEP